MDENLSSHYEVIICGTGLTESILAAAFQFIEKPVLHFDALPFYGRMDSSLTYSQFNDFKNNQFFKVEYEEQEKVDRIESDGVDRSSDINNSISDKNISEISDNAKDSNINTIEIPSFNSQSLSYCIGHNNQKPNQKPPEFRYYRSSIIHPSTKDYIMEKDCNKNSNNNDDDNNNDNNNKAEDSKVHHPSFFGYLKHKDITPFRLLGKSRDFSIDLQCRFVLGAGDFLDSLVNSGVSKYLEFKSIEGVFYMPSDDAKLSLVPCSKSDVFNSTLLSAIEKRILMKFIQYVMDWGLSDVGQEVNTLNEKDLSRGRSLHRPQNKAVAVDNKNNNHFDELNNKTFSELMETFKIPKKLQNIITFSLCLQSENVEINAIVGLKALYSHLFSLNRYGETAFLYPIYGLAEIAQAFCRMAAVWGATYILNRSISRVFFDAESHAVRGVVDSQGTRITCDALIINRVDWDAAGSGSGSDNAKTEANKNSYVLTRTSIVEGDKAFITQVARGLAIIPPDTQQIRNKHPIQVIQLDHTLKVCPEHTCLLYISTIVDYNDNEKLVSFSNDVFNYFNSTKKMKEIDYAISLKPFNQNKHDINNNNNINHLFVTNESSYCVHLGEALAEAKAIFHQLYPNEEFFPAKNNVNNDEDIEDIETQALEDALSAMQNAE